MQFDADYYDGISARPKLISVRVQQQQFVFNASDANDALSAKFTYYDIADCDIQAKLGHTKRAIDLPDGGRLETDYQDLEQCLPKQAGNLFWRAVYFAENHKSIILLSLIGIFIASLLLLQYGIPTLANYTAKVIPASTERKLGQQTLDTLDREKFGYFSPSRLSPERKQAIEQALTDLCNQTKDCPDYALHFRKGKAVGANAFALPGGFVVITDELIELAKHDDEVISVLSHELGHVKQRHALRQTLQSTIAGLIIIAVTGDVSAIAAGLPAVMLNMHYSRGLENEADAYALQSLKTACIPTKRFATMLLRLEKQHSGGQHVSPEILSSHPDTQKRVIPFLQNKENCQRL